MDFEKLIPGIIGAFVGVVGWLLVGLYIQRRQFVRQARNAARAVYFELDVNRLGVEVARDFGSFTLLNRSSFERLLPELAMLLPPGELRTIVAAYMSPRRLPAGRLRRGTAACDPQAGARRHPGCPSRGAGHRPPAGVLA